MSYPDYAERTFFWRVTGDEIPIKEILKFFNKNFTKYLSKEVTSPYKLFIVLKTILLRLNEIRYSIVTKSWLEILS